MSISNLFYIISEEIEGTDFVLCFAHFPDGSIYRTRDCPSMSEGFPSLDPLKNVEYIKKHWDKVA